MAAVLDFGRRVTLFTAVAGIASVLLGVLLGLFQGESIVRWIAYGLDIGGAAMIGLGFVTGPPSPRQRYLRERILKEKPTHSGESKLLLFVSVGLLLVAAGTLIEFQL